MHPIDGGVLQTRIILRSYILPYPHPVVRMDGIDYLIPNGICQLLKCIITQKPYHLMVGKIQRESLLTVSANHSAGRHLRKYGRRHTAVLLCQLHEGPVLPGYMDHCG